MLEMIDLTQKLDKATYKAQLEAYQTQLRILGYYLYQRQRPAILVFEGWDAGGKGGAIKRLTERMDPRGYIVYPIAAPKGDDAEKHYLWRFWRRLPAQGTMAIFDRSWYGRVMVERVEGFAPAEAWQRAYGEIRDFEQQLVDFGAIVMKFWIHISKEEQLHRFERREARAHKAWKLTDEDWRNREKWDQYEQAVEDMLIKTTTVQAPWTVIAGNDKHFARVQVLQTVAERLSQELGVDATPEHLHELPPLAAVVPVPAWAKAEAKALGLKLDGTIQQPAPKASKKAQKQRKSKHDRK
jgi:polyphosphate kinase 2 (PPK2 family)